MKAPLEPPHDCPLCPRLAAFRADNRKKHSDWFNAPVPCFGPRTARLAIAGLAPGLQGANRTGRPFTGDWAGDLLYATLLKMKLAKGVCRIVNSVRCVPPQNKPEPSEIKTCRQFLISELETMPNVNTILALGKIAHDSVLKTLDARIAIHPFKHGAVYKIGKFQLISSYHCSRYNTNTGVLTTKMFEDVVAKAKALAAIA
jgi:uracil-DNA glycosylase family 4